MGVVEFIERVANASTIVDNMTIYMGDHIDFSSTLEVENDEQANCMFVCINGLPIDWDVPIFDGNVLRKRLTEYFAL